jgi:hypothetical protein
MNAKEYSDQFPFDGDVQSGFIIMSEKDLVQVMEEYANHHLNNQQDLLIKLAPGNIKTLIEEDGVWSYVIETKNGRVTGSEIKNEAAAVEHCEKELLRIVQRMLEKH